MPSEAAPLWRLCEIAWMGHLAADSYLVTRLADATHNFEDAAAPLIQLGDRLLRAPDLQATRAGVTEFWEVKYRSRAEVNSLTGKQEYWISAASFSDYVRIRETSGSRVRVILHDAELWRTTRKWLHADIEDLANSGRRDRRVQSNGEEVDAWVWPSTVMKLVDGPAIGKGETSAPILVPINDEVPHADDVLVRAERDLRRPDMGSDAPLKAADLPAGVFDVLRRNASVRLNALVVRLGIPEQPRYSVMRIGTTGIDVSDILELMRYGIRVVVIAEEKPDWDRDPEWVEACEEGRLLEWAEAAGVENHAGWVVDGAMSPETAKFLESSSDTGTFNMRQFRVVHEHINSDILVQAGAGTGKTETMSERIIFLLSTCSKHADPRDESRQLDLSLEDVVLITFTREASREMRGRIARSMMLRQRLCDLCVLPTTAWLLGLSRTEVETIHTWSKKLLQRDGIAIGLSPSFEVREMTMEFRRIIDDSLSPLVDELLDDPESHRVPPVHELRQQVENLWARLSENGISPLALIDPNSGVSIDWGKLADDVEGRVASALHDAVLTSAEQFKELCARNQVMKVSELIPSAARVIAAVGKALRRRPRYVFVDEFQDTDSEQIRMILNIRQAGDARLFVVGDEKQAIYRFRGAQGNAFAEMKQRMSSANLAWSEFILRRNFRSGKHLLDSMHPHFSAWGAGGHLEYDDTKRLRAADHLPPGLPARFDAKKNSEIDGHVLSTVGAWLRNDPTETVGILCRSNKEAKAVQALLRGQGIPCVVRVGGDFYRTPAVRELRVFLEAVLNPYDDAALLELAETRWYAGLACMQPPIELGSEGREVWGADPEPLLSWPERLASMGPTGSADRRDLERVRARVIALGRLLEVKPVLSWLMECESWMQPRLTALPGATDVAERTRYALGFDHLVTKLDEDFGTAPISPHRLLEWLRLKIATDKTEDEPFDDGPAQAGVTAVTVHKSKGLEYDRVIIPRTAQSFSNQRHSHATAIVNDGPRPRLLWRWRVTPQSTITNVRPNESRLWHLEDVERVREEARLLYVAMTRARQELVVIVNGGKADADTPGSWADLLRMVLG